MDTQGAVEENALEPVVKVWAGEPYTQQDAETALAATLSSGLTLTTWGDQENPAQIIKNLQNTPGFEALQNPILARKIINSWRGSSAHIILSEYGRVITSSGQKDYLTAEQSKLAAKTRLAFIKNACQLAAATSGEIEETTLAFLSCDDKASKAAVEFETYKPGRAQTIMRVFSHMPNAQSRVRPPLPGSTRDEEAALENLITSILAQHGKDNGEGILPPSTWIKAESRSGKPGSILVPTPIRPDECRLSGDGLLALEEACSGTAPEAVGRVVFCSGMAADEEATIADLCEILTLAGTEGQPHLLRSLAAPSRAKDWGTDWLAYTHTWLDAFPGENPQAVLAIRFGKWLNADGTWGNALDFTGGSARSLASTGRTLAELQWMLGAVSKMDSMGLGDRYTRSDLLLQVLGVLPSASPQLATSLVKELGELYPHEMQATWAEQATKLKTELPELTGRDLLAVTRIAVTTAMNAPRMSKDRKLELPNPTGLITRRRIKNLKPSAEEQLAEALQEYEKFLHKSHPTLTGASGPAVLENDPVELVEQLKAEYIKHSTKFSTLVEAPAFTHRQYEPVDKFLISLVEFENGLSAHRRGKPADLAGAAAKCAHLLAEAKTKAETKEAREWFEDTDESLEFHKHLQTARGARNSAAKEVYAGAKGNALDLLAEFLVKTGTLAGGVTAVKERPALTRAPHQLAGGRRIVEQPSSPMTAK